MYFRFGSGGAATAALTHFLFTLGESHVTFATIELNYAEVALKFSCSVLMSIKLCLKV